MTTYGVDEVDALPGEVARTEVRSRIGQLEADGLAETARFLRHLDQALSGSYPMDEVGIVAALAEAVERLERRVFALEHPDPRA